MLRCAGWGGEQLKVIAIILIITALCMASLVSSVYFQLIQGAESYWGNVLFNVGRVGMLTVLGGSLVCGLIFLAVDALWGKR